MSSISRSHAVTSQTTEGLGTVIRDRLHQAARTFTDAFPPAPADGRPRGMTVGHALGEPLAVSLDGRPRGHMVGRPVAITPAGHRA